MRRRYFRRCRPPPSSARLALATAGPLPETIPFAYTSTTTYWVWVDKQLGVPLAVSIHRTVTANAALGGQKLPLLPVLDIDVKTTDDSVQASAYKAASAGRLLSIMSVWVPIVLIVGGVALVIVAVLRRQPAADVTPTRQLAGSNR